jgi:hypothetical protein
MKKLSHKLIINPPSLSDKLTEKRKFINENIGVQE